MEPAEVGAAKTINAIRPETWEQINRALLSGARQAKLEDGAVVRLDSTVTSALLHEPSDSSLLWDAVRVMVRLLKRADELAGGAGSSWHDHRRAAKKRTRVIQLSLPGRAVTLSKTEYAQRAGVSKCTVSHWIAGGKLTAPALRPDGRIDPVLADRQVHRTVDPLAREAGRNGRHRLSDARQGHRLRRCTGPGAAFAGSVPDQTTPSKN